MPSYNNADTSAWGFDTRSIHAGQNLDPATGARNQPIFFTSSYVFNDTAHGESLFALQEEGFTYSRLASPTSLALQERLADLEGGKAAVAFASGMAAETAAILNVARAGDHIVASPRLYGGTETLLQSALLDFGIETTFVENPDDPESWHAAARPNTKAFYAETFGNPFADVLDIPAVAEVAHANRAPLIVDNTIATAALVRPLELGADIVVASLTKFYTGNGSGLGGIVVDGDSFDWAANADKFPQFNEPDATYHGIRYVDGPAPAFATRVLARLLRDTGGCISPFNAWLTLQGLDTLGLRIERHGQNALQVAQYLEAHPKVAKVNFAGLESSPYYATKEKLGIPYTGSVLSFDIAGDLNDRTAAWRFIDALQLHSNLANVGDVRSLVVHPASITHAQSDAAGLARAGISQATVRLSVGLENIDDIIADLDRGFAAVDAATA